MNTMKSHTFGVAITPSFCVPLVISAPPIPARYGSRCRRTNLVSVSHAVRIWTLTSTKTFPIPATAHDSSNRAYEWAKSNMNPFASIFSTKSMTVPEHQVPVEGCSKMNASRK
jgi:hypothetical protein